MSTAYLMAGDRAAAADKLRKALDIDPSLFEGTARPGQPGHGGQQA